MDPNIPDLGLPSKSETITLIIAMILGIWGGIAKYLNDVLKDRRQMSFLDLCIYGFSSGFCGLLTGMLLIAYNQDNLIVYFVTGIAGGAGWSTMDWFIATAKRKATKEFNLPTETEETENGK